MPFPSYDAVIFDLDGTLVDSESLYMESALRALHRLGHQVERAFMLALVGHSDAEGQRRLKALLGDAFDSTAFNVAWADEAAEALQNGVPAMPEAHDLLSALHDADIPRALATNSHTRSARIKLDQSGLTPYFQSEHVFGYDRVANPKPAPDLFLEAARALGADPARCLVFEDSPAGVTGAVAAGMQVVHVTVLLPDPHPDAHIHATSLLGGARAARLID